uniref:Putative secreted protein n=1 Tax=Ixodes ricinus TaxID=34613 RepID=A0A6B0UGY3_IXORI
MACLYRSLLFFSLIHLCSWVESTWKAAMRPPFFWMFITVLALRTTSIMPTCFPVERQAYGIILRSSPSFCQMLSIIRMTWSVSMSCRRSSPFLKMISWWSSICSAR